MDKVIWFVSGNKGGVGKSVVAKALVQWLCEGGVDVLIAEGDKSNADIRPAFPQLAGLDADLEEEVEWQVLSDSLCTLDEDKHVVVNMPDGLSQRMLRLLGRAAALMQNYGWSSTALFVMNTLPDGLGLLPELAAAVDTVVPVKNLHFGRQRMFKHFDDSDHDPDQVLLFPGMQPNVMRVVRESRMSYRDFFEQTGPEPTNFVYGKIVVADWYQTVSEAFEESLSEVYE